MAPALVDACLRQPWHAKCLLGCLAAYLLAVALAIPLGGSASWFVIGALVCLVYLVQSRLLRSAPTQSSLAVFPTLLLFYWLLACTAAALSFFAVLAAGGFNSDDFLDFLGSVSVIAVSVAQVQWRSGEATESESEGKGKGGKSKGSWLWVVLQVFGGGFALFAISVIVLDAFGRLVSLLVHPPVSFVDTPLGLIHYYCQGVVRNNTVMIFEAGFMGPSSSLFFIQDGLFPYTRTCLYDRSGEGWSQPQADVGFIGEARNMRAVLDQEFRRAGVEVGSRNVVVGGHSRGFQSAARFKVDYNDTYKRVLVVELDGSVCNKNDPIGIVDVDFLRYGLTPFTSMFSGLVWIVWPFVKDLVLSNPLELGFGKPICKEFQVGDLTSEGEFLQRLLKPNIWRNSAERDIAWEEKPALTSAQCTDFVFNSPDFLEIRARDLLILAKDNVTQCEASHTSIVIRSDYAAIAVQRIVNFLDSRDLT